MIIANGPGSRLKPVAPSRRVDGALCAHGACDQCRLRRVRCDGNYPSCAACRKQALIHGKDPNLIICAYRKKPSMAALKQQSSPDSLVVAGDHHITEIHGNAARIAQLESYLKAMDIPATFDITANSAPSPTAILISPTLTRNLHPRWRTWPASLSYPTAVTSLIAAFLAQVRFMPFGLNIQSFIDRLWLPADHPDFPGLMLVHAACAAGALLLRNSASLTLTGEAGWRQEQDQVSGADGDSRNKGGAAHEGKAKGIEREGSARYWEPFRGPVHYHTCMALRYTEEALEKGVNLVEVAQTYTILGTVAAGEMKMVQALHLMARTHSLVEPLLTLIQSGAFAVPSVACTSSREASQRLLWAREKESTANTVIWSAATWNRSSLVGPPISSRALQTQKAVVRLPTPAEETEDSYDHSMSRTLGSATFYSHHPPSPCRSYYVHLKSNKLLQQIRSVVDHPPILPADDLIEAARIEQEWVLSEDWRAIMSYVSQFEASIPPLFPQPIRTWLAVDSNLLLAHAMLLSGRMLIYDRLMSRHPDDEARSRAVKAAEELFDIIMTLWPLPREFPPIELLAHHGSTGIVLIRDWAIAEADGDTSLAERRSAQVDQLQRNLTGVARTWPRAQMWRLQLEEAKRSRAAFVPPVGRQRLVFADEVTGRRFETF